MHRVVKLLVLCFAMLALAAPAMAKPKNGMVQGGPTGGMSSAKNNALMYYMYRNRNRGRRGVSTGAGYGGGPVWDARSFGYPTGGF